MRRWLPLRLAVTFTVVAVASALLPVGPVPTAAALPLSTTLVSADATGVGGDGSSQDATVSDDSRFVAFLSRASNLVPDGPTDGNDHLYRKNRLTGAVEWVDGGLGGAFVAEPVLSGDGQHIAFWAQTSSDSAIAIYRWSAATGEFATVVDNPPIHRIAISDDGQQVLFIADDPALDPLGATGQQAYLWNDGTTSLVSRSADGTTGANNPPQSVALSGDGSTAVFEAAATNLVEGQGSTVGFHLYRVDLSTGSTSLVDATTPGGTQPVAASSRLRGRNAVSDDGRTIAFTTTASVDELIPGTTDVSGGGGAFGSDDTLVLDLDSGYRLLSRSATSATTTCDGDFSGASLTASLDDEGDTAVFSTSCEELRGNTGGRGTDLFRLDLTDPTSAPEHISTKADGTPVADDGGGSEALPSLDPAPSGNALVVTYTSRRALIVAEDTNNRPDVFGLDLTPLGPPLGPERVSAPATGALATGESLEPSVSDDGRFVAFLSSAADLTTPPSDGSTHAFVKDRLTGAVIEVPRVAGVVHDSAVAISGDGNWVAVAGADSSGLGRPVWIVERTSSVPEQITAHGGDFDVSPITELAIDDDGGTVATIFPDLGASEPVQLFRRQGGGTWNASLLGNKASGVSLSGDGGTVVWTDRVPQVPGLVLQPRHADPANDGAREVYAHDLDTATTVLVSSEGTPGTLQTVTNPVSNGHFTTGARSVVSDDGTRIAFTSLSVLDVFNPNFFDSNGGFLPDVVVADLGAGSYRLASAFTRASPGFETCNNSSSVNGSISDDGLTVTFMSDCQDEFGVPNWIVARQRPGANGSLAEPVSIRGSNGLPDGDPNSFGPTPHLEASSPVSDQAGTLIVWDTVAPLRTDDTNNARDLYARPFTNAVPDADNDGFPPTEDCDDGDPTVNPDAVEDRIDFVDENCDGFLDEVRIFGNGVPSQLGAPFADDVSYALLVDGTFQIGGPGRGDAEYAFTSADNGEIDHCFGDPNATDIGVAFDVTLGSNVKAPNWGPFDTDHTYEIGYVGSGNQPIIRINDCGHGDNGGELRMRTRLAAAQPKRDTGSAVGGVPIDFLDVMANDLGDFDDDSLSVMSVDVGTATVVESEGGPMVRYLAPADFSGTATITYSVTGSDGVVVPTTATLTVSSGLTGLDLDWLDEVVVPLATPTPVFLRMSNNTGATLFSQQVSIRAATQGVQLGPVSGSDGTWTCADAGGGVVTCDRALALEDATPAPDLAATIDVAADAGLEPCDGAPASPPCAQLLVWNGSAADEPTASPAPREGRFPVATRQLAATIDGPDVVQPNQLETWSVDISNPGTSAAFDDPIIDVTLQAGDAFIAADSADPAWFCQPGNQTNRAVCTYAGEVAPGDTLAPLDVTFDVGEGSDDCDVPVNCVVVVVRGENGLNESPSLVLAEAEAIVTDNVTPPDLDIALTHSSPVRAGGTVRFVGRISNVGPGPTTGPVDASVELPVGMTPTSATGAGWSCSIDTGSRRADCSRSGQLQSGAVAPLITVKADVAPSATTSTVAAEIVTGNDADPLNDRIEVSVPVVPEPPGPDGAGALGLDLDGPETISEGQTVHFTATIANNGDEDTKGPTTFTVLLPDGLPGGQRLTAKVDADGWKCRTTRLRGTVELRCTHPDGVASNKEDFEVPIDITAVQLAPGGTVTLPFQVVPGGDAARATATMKSVPKSSAHLTTAFTSPTLRPGKGGELSVVVTNDGTGSTTEPLHLDVPAPPGMSIVSAAGTGWTCTVAPAAASCDNPIPLKAEQSSEPVAIGLAVAPATPGATVAIGATIRTADQGGEVVKDGSGLLVVEAPVPAGLTLRRDVVTPTPGQPATDAEGRVAYDIGLQNTGPTPMPGDLVVVERAPKGSAITGTGTGWTCATADETLTCSRPSSSLPGGGLAPGASAPPIRVTLDLAPTGGATSASVLGTARIGKSVSTSSTIALLVPAAPRPAPQPTIAARLAPTTLTRGGAASFTLDIGNSGSESQPAGLVVGALLPVGSTSVQATGAGVTCISDTAGQNDAVACSVDAAIGPGELRTIAIDLTVATNAPDEVEAHAGFLDGPPATALARLVSQGASPLRDRATDRRAVTGVIADAGEPRQVFDLTEQGDDSLTPTTVALDGTASGGGADLSFTWVQTSGPAVSWTDPTGERRASDGSSVPTASGARPTFVAPRIRNTQNAVLGFELTVQSGTAVETDTTTVTVAPFPNRAPQIEALTLVGGDPGVTPADGTRLDFTAAASDPDGDRLSYSWHYTRASRTKPMKSGSDPTRASVAWPRGADIVVVEVTVTDGRNGTATRQLTIGTPPPPLTVTINTPTSPLGPVTDRAPAGMEINVEAQVAGADPLEVFWRWTQVRGPQIDPLLLLGTVDETLKFDAPAGAFPGDAVVLRATAIRGSGAEAVAASADVTIELEPLPPPTVVIAGPMQTGVGAPANLQAIPTGVAPFTFQWQALGAVGLVSSTTTPTVTYQAPTPAVAIIMVTITDKTGRTATGLATVTVGGSFTPSSAAPSCADASTLAGRAFNAAATDGFLAGTFGPMAFDLGQLNVASPCGSAAPSLSVADATISIASGLLTGTSLGGSVTEDRLCLDDGELNFPESWGLSEVTLGAGAPVCLDLDPSAAAPLTGSMSTTGLPFLPMPDGIAPPQTALSFDSSSLVLSTAFALPTGGDVAGELVVDLDSGTGDFESSVTITDLPVFGQTADLAGTISGDATTVDNFTVSGSIPGPLPLLPGTELRNIGIEWTLGGLTAEAEATVGGSIELDLSGLLVDAQNWSLTATAQTGPPLTPLPNLTIDPSGFSGTVQSVDGVIGFDVRLTLTGGWSPVDVLTVEQLTAQLSSFPPPTDCVGVGDDEVWLAVSGAATLELGPPPIEVSAQACVGFGSGAWSLASTATFGSWRPVSGVDVAVQDLGIVVGDDGSGITIDAQGRVLVFGVELGARVFVNTTDLSIVVDGFGDLSSAGLGLPPGSTGHIVLASADSPDFRFTDPVLAGVEGVDAGLGMFAGFAPDPALGTFMSDVFGLPPITALVVSAQLSGTDITLRAAITIGGGGIPLFEVCGSGSCTPEQLTSLRLTELALSISLTGRIGFAATSELHLPASPDGQVPESELNLTAEIAIDLAGPAITLALFTSDGTWNGALGVPGLNLADLAIQGGVNFASPVPVPTVGFGATIERLPDEWAELIGADPNAQEPMSFVLNISQTAPILALNIGVDDGNIALRPLTAVGQPDALEVDYAKLVIAPFGGVVGPYTFSPGLSMGFAAVIMDVPVDVSATISVDPALIEASVDVGTVSLGGITVNGVSGLFRIDATGLLIDLDGSLTIPNGPQVDAGVLVEANLGGLTADFSGTAEDWDLGTLIKIDQVTLSAHAELPTIGAPAAFALGLDADGTILTVPVSLGGEVTMQGATLKRAELEATVAGFRVGPSSAGVIVNGKGCDNVTGGPGGDGACLRTTFDDATTPKVTASLNGEITVSGIKATIAGAIDGTGVSASGSLTIPTVGSFAVSGRLYSGVGTALNGLTDTLPNGTAVQVQNGNLKMKLTTATSVELAGFDSSLKASIGRLGSTSFVAVDGTLHLLGNNVTAKAAVSVNASGQLKYHIEVDMNLGIAGYTLASGHVVIDDVTGVDATGSVNLGDVGTLTITGGFTPSSSGSSATYHLSVDTTITLLTLSLAAAIDLEDGDLTVDINLNNTVFDGGSANLHLHGEASSSGRFCADVSVNIDILGTNPTGTLSFCNKNPGKGFKATLSVHGYVLAQVSITVPNFEISHEFGPYGGEDEVNFYNPPIRAALGANFNFDVEVTISVDDGLTLDGSGGASAYYEVWDNEGSFWEPEWVWTRHTIASIGISIDEVDRSACGEVGALGLTAEVCV